MRCTDLDHTTKCESSIAIRRLPRLRLFRIGFYRGYEAQQGEEDGEEAEAVYYEEFEGGDEEPDMDEEDDEYADEEEQEDLKEGNLPGAAAAASGGASALDSGSDAPKQSAIARTGIAAAKRTSRLNPSAPTFLNPSARTFVPPTKAEAAAAHEFPDEIAAEAVSGTTGAGSGVGVSVGGQRVYREAAKIGVGSSIFAVSSDNGDVAQSAPPQAREHLEMPGLPEEEIVPVAPSSDSLSYTDVSEGAQRSGQQGQQAVSTLRAPGTTAVSPWSPSASTSSGAGLLIPVPTLPSEEDEGARMYMCGGC